MSLCTFSYFFDLPPEIREQILQYLCIYPKGIEVGHAASDRDADKPQPLSAWAEWYEPRAPTIIQYVLDLFLVNLQFYRETSAIYFGQNVFHLHAVGRRNKGSQLLDPTAGLLAAEAFRPSRRRIRHAVLHLRRLSGQFQTDVAPALFDMILNGNLRILEFHFAPPFSSSWNLHASTVGVTDPSPAYLAQSRPFKELMRLLTDPDLERAGVAVSAARHWRLWCSLHAKPCNSRGHEQPCLSTWGAVGRRGASEDEMLDVDVGQLIAQYGEIGDQLRIFKVGD